MFASDIFAETVDTDMAVAGVMAMTAALEFHPSVQNLDLSSVHENFGIFVFFSDCI